MTARRSGIAVSWPLGLAALSGAAGLMHQLLWVRRMVDVLGAQGGTFSRVVAAFFLGLALGAWIAARRPTPRPWRSVAWAELGVATLALMVLASGGWVQSWPSDPLRAQLLNWLLPLLLIAPPAMAMGLVIPWMIRATGPQWATAIYGVNTLGGIAGLAIAPGWALPALGLAGASLLALGVNLVVAAGAWILTGRERGEAEFDEARKGGSFSRAGWATAFASGFLVLGSEVVFQHQFAQLLISSHLSSALVLGLVLAALGGAALLVPVAARKLGGAALPVALALAALACAVQPLTLIAQRGGMGYLPFDRPFGAYILAALKLGLPACALVLLPAGFVFPLLLRQAAQRGVEIGRLLAVNGLGGWLGAELTERFLLPGFGLWTSLVFFAAGYAICFALHPVRARWLVAAGLAGALVFASRVDLGLPYAGLTPGDALVKVGVGREGVVGVVRGAPDDWRILFDNTYTLGGSRAQTNQERQTLLPMLLHGRAERVATLGVATGSSLAGATLDPALVAAEGIELSPLVLHFALEDFAPWNRQIGRDPRMRFTLGDARLIVAQRPEAFDVIAGDLFLPWRTGEGRLFAREHFQRVRAALRPGGLFCQWLPMYQLTQRQYETIVRTFREVFPEAWLIRGDFYTQMPILGLVGGRDLRALDWAQIAAACERVRTHGACRDPLLRHAEGVVMSVLGPVPLPPPGPVNTLANSWIEWDAAHNVIGQREPWFVGVPGATYVRDVQRAGKVLLPTTLRDAQEAGQFFLTLEIARGAKLPNAESLTAQIPQVLPRPLAEDLQAEWTHWPMRYRPLLPVP